MTKPLEPVPPLELTARQCQILDFEQQWQQHAGQKEEAIRLTFGISSARYYQLLNALIDSPVALRYDPMLVKRLLRLREARQAARAARSLPPQG